jgi:DNA-binding MarR family transcriptional regulator
VSVDPIDTSVVEGLLGYATRRASMAFLDQAREDLVPLGLRPVTLTVLALVARNPGITASQLGEVLRIRSPNMVPLVKSLAERDLLVREPRPGDRRAQGLRATAAGQALLARALAVAGAADARTAAALDAAEQRQLAALLARVRSSTAAQGDIDE